MLDVRILEQIINCRNGALETLNVKELSAITNIQTIYKEIEVRLETELTDNIKKEILIYFQQQIEENKNKLNDYVETTSKATINNHIETDSKPKIENHISFMVDNIDKTEAFIKIEEKMNEYVETVNKPTLNTYVEAVKKPEIQQFTDAQKVRLEELINSHAVQGNLVFQTIAERDDYVNNNAQFPEKVFVGLTVFIIDEMMNYYYKGNGAWGQFHSSATVHIGPTPPEDTTKLWINPEEEDVDQMITGAILTEFREVIHDVKTKVYDLDYAINKNIEAGVFDPPIENEDGTSTPFPKTVERLKIKRGAKRYLVDADLQDGEMAFLKDTNELVICNNGKIINVF